LTDSVYSYTLQPYDSYLFEVKAPQNDSSSPPNITETVVSHEEKEDSFIVNGKTIAKKHVVAMLRLTARKNDQDDHYSTLLIPLVNTQKVFILGRANSKTDFYVNDRKPQVVSRVHAKIFYDSSKHSQDQFVIEDASVNGTYVNNIRIKKATLRDGDIVHFGHSDASISQGAKVDNVKSSCCYVFETYTNSSTSLLHAKQYQAMIKKEIEKLKVEYSKKLESELEARMKKVDNNSECKVRGCNWIILDTNCLIDNGTDHYLLSQNQFVCPLELLMCRKDTIVVIPYMVLRELDGLKKSKEHMVANSSRIAISFLDTYFKKQNPSNTVRVPGIVGQRSSEELSVSDGGLPSHVPDDRILNCCLYYQNRVANTALQQKVYLLTGDKNLRVKALVNSCSAMSLQSYLRT
jgi:pSer/pThr/pTyr-binding forkhead associated (FHA) protein/rRNA-processing protein FCF1